MKETPEQIRARLQSYLDHPDEVIPEPRVKRRMIPLERAPVNQCPACGQVVRR